MRQTLMAFTLTGLALTGPLSAPGLALANPSPEHERQPQEKPQPNSLEHGFWDVSDKAERDAKTSGERDFDPALNAYVRSVADKVAGPYAPDLRVYIMDRPFFKRANGAQRLYRSLDRPVAQGGERR